MTRTFLQSLRTVVQGRTANIASSTNATPIVVTRTAASSINISAASGTPIKITTSAAHGLRNGDPVDIAAVGGNTAANGNGQTVTVIDAFNFFLNGSASNTAYTSGGTVTPWLFQDGDFLTVAGHATNTGANGLWASKSTSSVLSTLINPWTSANSVGNGVGAATGTIVHQGGAQSPSLDISGLTNISPSVRVRVRSQDAGAEAVFFLRDSVDNFVNFQPSASLVTVGKITPQSTYEICFPSREITRLRFGVASAKLQIVLASIDAGASVEYDAFLEY